MINSIITCHSDQPTTTMMSSMDKALQHLQAAKKELASGSVKLTPSDTNHSHLCGTVSELRDCLDTLEESLTMRSVQTRLFAVDGDASATSNKCMKELFMLEHQKSND